MSICYASVETYKREHIPQRQISSTTTEIPIEHLLTFNSSHNKQTELHPSFTTLHFTRHISHSPPSPPILHLPSSTLILILVSILVPNFTLKHTHTSCQLQLLTVTVPPFSKSPPIQESDSKQLKTLLHWPSSTTKALPTALHTPLQHRWKHSCCPWRSRRMSI